MDGCARAEIFALPAGFCRCGVYLHWRISVVAQNGAYRVSNHCAALFGHVVSLALEWCAPLLSYPIPVDTCRFVGHLWRCAVGIDACVFARPIIPPRRQAVAAVVMLLALASVWLDVRLTRTMLLPGDPVWRASQLNATIPAGAIVLSTRAVSDHLYVSRTFIDVPVHIGSTRELAELLQRQRVSYIVSHYGMDATADSQHLRIGATNRFMTALEPLIQANVVELKFADEPNDLTIYRVSPMP